MSTFTISKDQFLLDNQPFRILSGAMYYFRIVPQYWEDRLHKLRAMGLNTVETYVAWNLHEPRPGEFHFEDGLDLVKYIQLAAESGLKVLVRPGPYICSEWELGGLPAWLLKDPGMRLRCLYRPYLEAIDRYFNVLIPRLAPLQVTHGGPILAMQVENEYGNYGNDRAYLEYLRNGLRSRGIDVMLLTSDGPTDNMLQGGTLPDVFKTVNFGENAREAFQKLRQYQPDGPLMCTEFWNGWLDHWGEIHHTDMLDAGGRPRSCQVLEEILEQGASVSLYMFHGGTNFGFMNGANQLEGPYQPTVTSYDYAAPLSEEGDVTPKYLAFRDILWRYTTLPVESVPPSIPKRAWGTVKLTEFAPLFENLEGLGTHYHRTNPEPMEHLDQNYGFILYHTRVSGPRSEAKVTLHELHDRALVFIDGQYRCTLERERGEDGFNLSIPPEGAALDILVENMGRINYGPYLHDRKGITQAVLFKRQFLFGWDITTLPFSDLGSLVFKPFKFDALYENPCPAFFRGSLEVTQPADTFLALPGWTRGVAWVNGFNLGRYWQRGPQRTLYVPAPLLKPGRNEVIVFELHGAQTPTVEFRDHPDLG